MSERDDITRVLFATSHAVYLLTQALIGDSEYAEVKKGLEKVWGRLQRAERAAQDDGLLTVKFALKEVLHEIKRFIEVDFAQDDRVLTKQLIRDLVKAHFDLREFVVPDSLKLKNFSVRPDLDPILRAKPDFR